MNKYVKFAGIIAAAAVLALSGCGKQKETKRQDMVVQERGTQGEEKASGADGTDTGTAAQGSGIDDTGVGDREPADVSVVDLYGEGSNAVLVYRLFTPKTDEEKVPLLVYLHGAGRPIGDDNVSHITSTKDAYNFVTDEMQEKHPCYVLAPQLPKRFTAADEAPTDEQSAKGWTDQEVQTALMETIQEIADVNGNVDMNRIYITGHSMGALGVWGMITAYPDTFAAAVPISGLWDGNVDNLTALPIWIFHGENDQLVPVDREIMLRDKLEELGGNIRMTIYTDGDFAFAGVEDAHGANVLAYGNQEMFDWMFEQKKD